MLDSTHAPGPAARPIDVPCLPFPPKTGAGGIPRILTALIDKLDAYLEDPADCLPSLNVANGKPRQQRRDRRFACVQLLRAHIKYLDLSSLRVGIPQRDGNFMSVTLRFLARQAGIGLRRAERAMRDLQSAGLVRSQSRCEKDDAGQYRGLASLRQLPPALFGAFGLAKWLKHERSKAILRRYRAAAAAAKAGRREREAAQGALFLDSMRHQLERGRKAAPRSSHANAGQLDFLHRADPQLDDLVRRRIGALKLQHPDWDREACYEHAYRELGSTARHKPFTTPPLV
jgi:hypothetical protein